MHDPEMRILVRGFVRWLIIVLLTLNVIIWGSIIAHCQEHKKLHPDRDEWEESVRFKVIEITSIDSDLIYWTKFSKKTIILSSFGYDKTLITDMDFKFPAGCYESTFCMKHSFIYMLWKIDKKFCK